MKLTRREFLKGIGIITAGTGLGALVASLPKPTYEVPNRSGDDFWIGNPDLYKVPKWGHPPMVWNDAEERRLYIYFDESWWLDGKRVDYVPNT